MDSRLPLYTLVILAYIGYPLYLMMGPTHARHLRVLALELVIAGFIGIFWPGGAADFVLLLAGASVAIGLALLFRVPANQAAWLIALAYSLSVLGSASVTDPIWTLIAALVFVISLERTVVRRHLAAAHG